MGEYEILCRIGAGGMGVVYEGIQPVIGKRVAVKVLLPQLSSDDELVERFLSEARAVNAIRHRGIVDIFSFGQLPRGSHYFVMEYLEGEAFDRLIKTRAPLAPYDVLCWTEEVLDALDAAHASGIIHRDIKPSNLFLVNTRRGRAYVKLLDFGIAKLGAFKGEATPQTRASVIIGTPDYMSPEQARGRSISPATDLYALACVMFEMLTGKRLFKGENAMQTMFMHVENQPPRVSDFVSQIPHELDDLLLWALEKDPAQRPNSAADMRAQVEALLKIVPNERTQTYSPSPRSYPSGNSPATPGPATPGPASARSSPLTTPPPTAGKKTTDAPGQLSLRPSQVVTKDQPPTTSGRQAVPVATDGAADPDASTNDRTRIVPAPTEPPPSGDADAVAPSTRVEPLPSSAPPAAPTRRGFPVLPAAGIGAAAILAGALYFAFRNPPDVVIPPPPKEAAPKEAAPKEAAPKEAAPKEAAPKEAAPKETAPKEAAPKETAPKETAPKEAAAKEAAAKEAAAKEAAAKEAAAKEAAAKEAAEKEAARKEAAQKEAARKEAVRKEAAAKEAARKDAAKKTGRVYSAADLQARLAALEAKLAARETKTGTKDAVVRRFLEQGKAQASAAQTDDARREVWKFLLEVDKQLGP